jgi:glycosyltransferase involved in cell wall biosynthesis
MRRSAQPHVRAIAAGGVLEALLAAVELRRRGRGGPETAELLDLASRGDGLARIAAAYAVGRHPGPAVDAALAGLLEAEDAGVRESAALSLSERPRTPAAIPRLRALASGSGFDGMLAGLALEDWSGGVPEHAPAPPRPTGAPLRIAQVHLHGRIDGGLRHAGAGEGGGLATLAVHLGRALGRRSDVGHAFTITRAFAGGGDETSDAVASERIGAGASIERIAFGPERYLAAGELWAYRRELEQALEGALARLLPLDVVHLRFADVGTLAAARACRRLGIPVAFTLAADPHAVIRAAERAGTLTRETFAAIDRRERYLFRIHVVESMLGRAEGLIVFPRAADSDAGVSTLLRLDPRRDGRRLRTVPEGVSLSTLDAAARACETAEPPVWQALGKAVHTLPSERAGLPLLLSVGRLNRVKGFDRLLEAWAGDDDLFATFNLAIVGGDLGDPTPEERAVLHRLSVVHGRHPRAREGLVLLGHRSHPEVAELLHGVRAGVPGAAAASGVYACASDKEEFGLALLEALATGLPVVAPRTGGPPTYVRDGVTGFLVETTSIADLRLGLRAAAAVRHDELRAREAAALVRSRFSVDAMAAELTSAYGEIARSGGLAAAA